MSAKTTTAEKVIPRLKAHYEAAVIPELMKQFSLTNVMAVPKITKIVVGVGVSEARENIKAVDSAQEEIAAITGQKPVVLRAKKSISNFKLREGMPIGIKVTLRGARMYEFLDRLISTAIPRIRDFRGLEPKGFDGHGNYNLGLTEQHIFVEINVEKAEKTRGMNITVCTTTKKDEQAKALLEALGFPFKKRKTN